MSSGPHLPHIHILVTVLSSDPHQFLDLTATPLGDGWCVAVTPDDNSEPVEWFAPRESSPFLRLLSEGYEGD